ncbi:hypothetical protein DB346_04425 [Verrucomicrobia bacterium LW23]|nr:hypothetical protein DB346_04425 [Verrucomicrobia bacterium LW23]
MNLKSLFTSKPAPEPEIFHDIHDFSILPFGLGDAMTWCVKSALRCQAAGRKGVHVHLVCDVKASGCTILMPLAHATDLFMMELVSAFTSHPLFSSLTLHSSRQAFDDFWTKLAATDPAARATYAEHLEIYEKRKNPQAVVAFHRSKCSMHAEINDWFRETGNRPRLRIVPECATDIEALKGSYPEKTFWVAVHSRLKRLDSGLKPSESGQDFDRDEDFTQWFHFMERTARAFPHVRFVVLGRLQEKPLALLRLPNVVSLRALGMGIGHEIAFINACNLFLGSLAGYAQIAYFSATDYTIISNTEQGADHQGIRYGDPQLPFALPGQRVRYGREKSDSLLKVLEERLTEVGATSALPGEVTTHRFFISPEQETRELYSIVSAQLLPLALKWDAGELEAVRRDLRMLDDTFPHVVSHLPTFRLLKDLSDLDLIKAGDDAMASALAAQKKILEARLVQLLYATVLEPVNGLFPRSMPGCSGMRRDGWCGEETKFTLGASSRGSTLTLEFGSPATWQPMQATIAVEGEKAVEITLEPAGSTHKVEMEHDHTHTRVTLRFPEARALSAEDPHVCSAHLRGIRIV